MRTPRWLGVAACAAAAIATAVPASGAETPSSLRQRAQELTRANGAIVTESRAAVLTLYALDTQLAHARARLADLQRQAAALDQRRVETRRALGIARRLVTASQRNLANRLRSAYEQGESDPLAIVLGARTLDDALSTIDSLNATAASDRRLVERARGARTAYVRLQRRLAARAAKLRRVQASVSATARSLAAAKTQRIAYIQNLAAQRRLNAGQIGSLESQARAIQSQAESLAVTHAATGEAGAAATSPPATAGRTLTVLATAYTLRGRTATGAPVGYGIVAVDPNVIPLGTRMSIPGYGEGVAADTGGAIQGAVIDVWFPSPAQAAAWGRRMVTITLH